MRTVLGIPLKGFDISKERLSDDLPPGRRSALARATAGRLLMAGREAGFSVVVVTPSAAVREWAVGLGADAISEPPAGGLNAAAAAIAETEDAWCVVHGDLPLVMPDDLVEVRRHLVARRSVLAPSRDGGTNVLGTTRPMVFSYGPGSFVRHLARLAGDDPTVIVSVGLTIEVDTIDDLRAASRLPGGAWLDDYLE